MLPFKAQTSSVYIYKICCIGEAGFFLVSEHKHLPLGICEYELV